MYMSPNASAVANGATTKEPKDGRLLKLLQNKFNVSCDTNSLLRHVPPWRKVKIFARSEELNGPAASVSSTVSSSYHQYLIRVSPLEGIKPLLCLSLGMLLSAARLARPILNRKVLPNSCIKSIRSITELKQNQSTFSPS